MITEDTASEGRDPPEPPEPPEPPGPEPPPPVAEGPPPPPSPTPGGRGRGRWVAVGAALVVVSLVAGLVGLVLERNDQERLRRAPLPQAGSQLDGGGVQLASLLASAKDHTFHARYTSTVDPQVSGGRLELEWWNNKDKTRIDTVLTQPDKVVRTASISAGKTSVTCQRIADEPWTCTAVDRPPTADPTGLVASLTAQLSGRSVTESTDTVAGHDARCFHVGAPGDPLDVCANREGVMLRVVSEQARYEIASLDAAVPESIFDPPAKP